VDGLNEEGIWAIADEIVDDEPERKPYPARADILSGTIFDSGLTLEPDFLGATRDFQYLWLAKRKKSGEKRLIWIFAAPPCSVFDK